jgi:hypothetical protein
MELQEKLKKMNELAFAITHGTPSDLMCPFCETPHIIFSFTRNKPPRYGLFIECRNCGRRQHFSLGEKPPNFRDDLVLDEYQHLEDEAMRIADNSITRARGASRK